MKRKVSIVFQKTRLEVRIPFTFLTSFGIILPLDRKHYISLGYLVQAIFYHIKAVLENPAPGRLVQKLLCCRLKSAGETNLVEALATE